jgi:hypothetical protein
MVPVLPVITTSVMFEPPMRLVYRPPAWSLPLP